MCDERDSGKEPKWRGNDGRQVKGRRTKKGRHDDDEGVMGDGGWEASGKVREGGNCLSGVLCHHSCAVPK